MKRLGAALYRLQQQWLIGLAILLIFVVTAVLVASAVYLVGAVGSWIFGYPWEDDPASFDWLKATAIVWLPLSVGMIAPALRPFTDRRMAERETDARASPYA